ncbi:MAG: hydrogenase maturation protease [Aggregatilineales bacterium]
MILVLGCGNPLRADDGIGPQIALALAHRRDLPGLNASVCHQLTPELAEPLSRAHRALFIDASVQVAPGALSIDLVEPTAYEAVLVHHLTPARLLAAARDWYGAAPAAWLGTVGVYDLGLSDRLSPLLRQALPALVEQVAAFIRAEMIDAS